MPPDERDMSYLWDMRKYAQEIKDSEENAHNQTP